MKVIFVTREGYRLAGARVRCYNFARVLNRYGVQAEVLSFADSLGAKDGEEEARMGIFSKAGYNLKAFTKLVKEKEAIFYIQRFNYHAFAPLLASLINKNKIIFDLDDWEMRENPPSKAHWFTRFIARRSVACIAASRFLENFLRPFNACVHYLPTGVDTELFKLSNSPGADEKIILSWTGTFHPKEHIENIRVALEAFAALHKKYKHIYFEILGDGIYVKELKNIVAGFNDEHIQIKSWINPDDVPKYLERVHIGILPVACKNKFNLAKSPTKLFEYMAMAKPTVSSDTGEAQEIVRNGENGFLAKSKEDFEEKLEILINDVKLRESMGQCAHQDVAKKYSLDILGKRLFEMIKAI